jgi:hypothetical protein
MLVHLSVGWLLWHGSSDLAICDVPGNARTARPRYYRPAHMATNDTLRHPFYSMRNAIEVPHIRFVRRTLSAALVAALAVSGVSNVLGSHSAFGPFGALGASGIAFAQEGPAASGVGSMEDEGARAPSSALLQSYASLGDEQTSLDRLDVHLTALADPAGATYRVWLRSDDQQVVLRAGDVTLGENGTGVLTYRQPAGESLLIQYSEVLLTLEPGEVGEAPGPIVLRGAIDPGTLVQARRLLARWPDSRYGTGSIQGLRRLADLARIHVGVLAEASAAGDLDTMRRKGEHLVNLVEGQQGQFFGDHNSDGRAEDPGDGVGFLPYAWGAITQTQFAWANATDDQVAAEALDVQAPVRFALSWAGFVRDAGMELASTRDLAQAREMAGHLQRAADRLAAAIDPAGDPALQQTLADFTGGALLPAYAEAQALVRIPLVLPKT